MVNFWRTTLPAFWERFSGCGRAGLPAVVNGDDCGRDVTGNAFAESTHGAIDFIYGTLAALPLGLLYFW